MAFFLSLTFLPKAELEIRILMEIIYFEKCFRSLGMGSRGESERGWERHPKCASQSRLLCGQLRLNPKEHLRNGAGCSLELPIQDRNGVLSHWLPVQGQGHPSNSPTGKRAGAPQTSPVKWAKMPLDKRWKIHNVGTSLVVQELRICLPMWGTQVRPLVWEDPTCQGATKSMHHDYWACVP